MECDNNMNDFVSDKARKQLNELESKGYIPKELVKEKKQPINRKPIDLFKGYGKVSFRYKRSPPFSQEQLSRFKKKAGIFGK